MDKLTEADKFRQRAMKVRLAARGIRDQAALAAIEQTAADLERAAATISALTEYQHHGNAPGPKSQLIVELRAHAAAHRRLAKAVPSELSQAALLKTAEEHDKIADDLERDNDSR